MFGIFHLWTLWMNKLMIWARARPILRSGAAWLLRAIESHPFECACSACLSLACGILGILVMVSHSPSVILTGLVTLPLVLFCVLGQLVMISAARHWVQRRQAPPRDVFTGILRQVAIPKSWANENRG